MKTSPKMIGAALAVLSLLTGCGGTSLQASAKDYPSDDITLVVPYPAGGPTDTVARALAPVFEKKLGESVVVENLDGASGAQGMQEMITQPPDGHTLQLVASTAMAVNPLVEDVGYTLEDVKTVGAVTQYPYVIAVRADSKFDTAEEFLNHAKSNPGTIRVGSPGAASQGHVELQRLAQKYGAKFVHVPYDGNSELNAALLGGNLDAIFLVASEDVTSLVEAGKFKALAIDSPKPVSYLDVPTLEQLGYEGIDMGTSYYGMGVHRDTPAPIHTKLTTTLKQALRDPKVREQLGEQYVPQQFVDGPQLMRRFKEQRTAYRPVVDQLH